MNAPPNQPPGFVTCLCQHCDGHIEFDATGFQKGETRNVKCPHCNLETIVFVPASQHQPPTPPRIPPKAQAVKGTILDFTVQTNTGIISGDDGQRYSFQGAEWREAGKYPIKGMRVDFSPRDGDALAIYEVNYEVRGGQGSGSPTTFGQRPLPYQGFYRSSDEKVFAGVCGGLAHKWGVSHGAVQAIFVILFFFFFGWLIYPVCWLAFKPLPTRGVKFSD